MDTGNVFDEFVEQDDRGIENRRTEAEENAGQIVLAAFSADADDENHANGRHDEADNLFGGQFFPEQEGAGHRDDDRRKIIAQGCNGDRGVLIGFKEQNPVDTHCHAGEEQKGQLFADCLEVNALSGDEEITNDQQRSQNGAVQRQFTGGDGNVSCEQADGAEDGHGETQHESGIHMSFHGNNLFFADTSGLYRGLSGKSTNKKEWDRRAPFFKIRAVQAACSIPCRRRWRAASAASRGGARRRAQWKSVRGSHDCRSAD